MTVPLPKGQQAGSTANKRTQNFRQLNRRALRRKQLSRPLRPGSQELPQAIESRYRSQAVRKSSHKHLQSNPSGYKLLKACTAI
jgi:hypothetical protein